MGTASLAVFGSALLLGVSPGALESLKVEATAALSPAAAEAQLDSGIRAMNDFDDALAHRIFTRLLAGGPPVAIAAKAHLYLGILDFNGLDTARAREEFKRAVEIDPAVEPPITMGPKARLAFDEARRTISSEYATPETREPAARAPPGAVAPEASTAAEGGKSHALGWTLGAGGVVLGAIAVFGLVQIVNYDSLASQVNAGAKKAYSSTEVAPALANAQSWQPWSIALGIAGVAAVTTAAFVW